LRFRVVAIRMALVWLIGHAWLTAARGDGGTLRYWERKGVYEIAVFTASDPFVAGPVDISVLVLDCVSGEPTPDAKVSVEAKPLGRPGRAISHPATTEASINKLLYAAVFELPESGFWVMEVTVEIEEMKRIANVRFQLEVAERLPPWVAWWPWVCWPVPMILLYGLHQYMVWRKTGSRMETTPMPSPGIEPGPRPSQSRVRIRHTPRT
jgi:hypothetical protein